MTEMTESVDQIEWIGGHPALDFVNTVHAWHGARPGEEYLRDYPDLIAWHRKARLLGPRGQAALEQGSTRAQRRALTEALKLRQALHDLFQAQANNNKLPGAALKHLNAEVCRTATWRNLSAEGSKITCAWDFTGAPPSAIVGPVVWSSAELLERGDAVRVKECPGPDCGWLFYDGSKNRSRTWCSMKTCGNTAKVQRFRARHVG